MLYSHISVGDEYVINLYSEVWYGLYVNGSDVVRGTVKAMHQYVIHENLPSPMASAAVGTSTNVGWVLELDYTREDKSYTLFIDADNISAATRVNK